MRLSRLARLFDLKYNLISTAAPYEGQRGYIKRDLMDAYNNYCNYKTAKPAYNILPYLAEYNEPHSKQIISLMKDIVDNFDKLDNQQLLTQLNGLLFVVSELQKDNGKEIRTSIHNSFVINKEADKNRREQAKSKWEQVVNHKLSSILRNQVIAVKELLGSKEKIMGGPISPIRRELSKEKLLMFSRTPIAEKYGFDSLDVLGKLLQYPDLRAKLTDVINAIDRGHLSPKSAQEISNECHQIKELFKQKQTNSSSFEQETSPATSSPADLFDEEKPESPIEGDPDWIEPHLMDPMSAIKKQNSTNYKGRQLLLNKILKGSK